MLMTLDQWLARFFGAGRRADRTASLSQRASFGLDGMEMHQIDGNFDLPAWDEEPESENAPYRPYVRRPLSVFVDPGQEYVSPYPEAAAPYEPASHADWAPPAPVSFDETGRDRLEAAAAQKSREILSAALQTAPQFRIDGAADSPHEDSAPQLSRSDQPNVRFTRTPEASIARRKAEEEAQRRAAEEAGRLAEEEARLKAEEQARRLEETRLAQSHAIDAPKPRVRYARTPDRVMQERNGVKPQPAPEPAAAPAAPVPPAPVAAAPATGFNAFAAMGARFSFSVGFGGISAPAQAAAPAPAQPLARAPVHAALVQAAPIHAAPVAEPEKPAKMRLRVKAVATPVETLPEPAAEAALSSEPAKPFRRVKTPNGGFLERLDIASAPYEPLSVETLAMPPVQPFEEEPEDQLEVNADALEKTLEDFGVRGDVLNAHPGPVVTLYEFEPAPGIKSSRVIGLADDIARSMSAVSARVAVVPGRNAIGIELPNPRRETVYLRELFASPDFAETKHKLAIALGKTIGGEPVIVDLAKMPHLLVAGTTGSGKSVAINTMILSLLYRLKPQECRLIMVDPKMLELSVYDGIPHLLTPVVTDPKKAVVALKWAVREMEDRYKKMSKLGVRNIDGFNARVTEAKAKGEIISRVVQTGFDRETGEAIYEQEQMDLSVLPYIVVIVDEMADLMMVAGKEIEGAIQRLAQMARAAGIHLIMATQRPSVDVITGTIKANFPTRISFQVTSKIDSRTILGEMGAEQLLGQGDMLYMAGGGRISRVHGPFVSDADVEKVVAHLKMQGQPDYLDSVTVEDDESDDEADASTYAADDEAGDLYDRAVAIVLRDKKCSTSYVQRRLSVGYNKAASLVERMEKEGVVGAANHAGKRQILAGGGIDRGAFEMGD
jgi:DNA segregation ATPase FtsK/SpoIIIE, S-DNA-T family